MTHVAEPLANVAAVACDTQTLFLFHQELAALRASLGQRLDALESRLPQGKIAIVVFSDDMDKVLAGFVIANGALTMGMEVSMYFTFWGLTTIKKTTNPKGKALKSRMSIFL